MNYLGHTSSLLSKDASAAIKGLLMLLIVFGHTSMLNTDLVTGEKTFFWNWLYSFHVYIFFILPFIYGYNNKYDGVGYEKQDSINTHNIAKDIKKNLIKLGIPYCWFFLISIIIYVYFGGGKFHLGGVLRAFFFGNQPLMKQYIGFHFIWFLPAMFSLLALKSLYYNSKESIKKGIIFISIILWMVSFLGVSRTVIGMYVPFALSQAFYFVIWGIISRQVCEKQYTKLLPLVILLILFLSYLLYIQNNPHSGLVVVLMLPILIFLVLFSVKDLLAKSHFLRIIGIYSLQIYLVHVYIVNAVDKILTHYFTPSWGLGVVIFILTLLISIGVSIIMVKVSFIKKVLFPSWTPAKK